MKKQAGKIAIIVLAVVLLVIWGFSSKPENIDVKVAKCIGERADLYTVYGCSVCDRQEELFGNNSQYLTIINCVDDTKKCREVGIETVPTWIVNGEKYVGFKSYEFVRAITGC